MDYTFKMRLLTEIFKTRGHITYSYNVKDTCIVLYFNSFLFDDMQRLPFFTLKEEFDLTKLNITAVLDDLKQNIVDAIDFRNESSCFYNEKDKILMLKESCDTVSAFFYELLMKEKINSKGDSSYE